MAIANRTSAVFRGGNFDAIRLAAASAVIFGHAFLLVTDPGPQHPTVELARQIAIAAVEIFFIISGYLVTQSFEHSPRASRFVAARVLRIAPGLISCVFLTAALGTLFTTMTVGAFWSDWETFKFVLYNAFLDPLSIPFLPAVRFHAHGYGAVVNSSLWSLQVEFCCYMLVLILGLLRQLNARVALCLLMVTALSLSFRVLDNYAWFVSYFAAGMCMYYLGKQHRLRSWLAALSAVAVVIGYFTAMPWALFPVFGAYAVVYAAIGVPFAVRGATRFGDLSYGIYLYGWTVEQIAVWLLGGHAAWWNVFLLALPICALLGCFSWNFIEAPLLRWKDVGPQRPWRRTIVISTASWAAAAIVFGIGGKQFVFYTLIPASLAIIIGQVMFRSGSKLAEGLRRASAAVE
jgi:peptidoglycan/LPS O-acetylase OafA/YrhL